MIETSPVGVAVFDAATGRPVSFNREADRIVSRLRIPNRPPEYLLEVMTCRFLDGREIALPELPIARVLSGAETLRAEQIELSVPDGRRVTMLINAGRIETGTLSVEPEPVEVAALVDQARNTFLSGGGRHTLAIDLPADLPRAMADERRIVQVLNNLVSNAARHSPETSPIRIEAVRDGVHVAISVADERCGDGPHLVPSKLLRVDGGCPAL